MGGAITNVVITCGPTHLLILNFDFMSNKICLNQTRGALDLPESESGFEIMIQIHCFI